MPQRRPTALSKDVSLRVRKARSVTSARIQSLASVGVAGGLLTPREIKEVCQAVAAEGEAQPDAKRSKPGEQRGPEVRVPRARGPAPRRPSSLDAPRSKAP